MAPQEGMTLPPAGGEVMDACGNIFASRSPGIVVTPIERFSFYRLARQSYAVVQTLERRPYANYILTKGVVGPDGKDLKP
mmetsp:Transcript_8795/g.24484  ORF Transcript_8795/g.24484 Transcript_8795/m.24484 type:complete len:80 (-) Transcript_8795:430-669(-)